MCISRRHPAGKLVEWLGKAGERAGGKLCCSGLWLLCSTWACAHPWDGSGHGGISPEHLFTAWVRLPACFGKCLSKLFIKKHKWCKTLKLMEMDRQLKGLERRGNPWGICSFRAADGLSQASLALWPHPALSAEGHELDLPCPGAGRYPWLASQGLCTPVLCSAEHQVDST